MRVNWPDFLTWNRRTDDQHIERLRQAVMTYDRWRGFVVSLYVFALVVFIFVVLGTVSLLTRLRQNFGQGFAGINAGFLLGVAIGLGLGFTAVKIIHGLLEISTGLKNERLLIQIHDVNQDLRQQLASASSCVR